MGRGAADPDSVRRILQALPDWFGEPASLAEYVADAERLPSYFARAGQDVIGAVLLRRHFEESAEIHLIAVAPGWHRRGVGRALVAAIEADLAGSATRLLQVKTIGPSLADPFYAETRKFYLSLNFLPLEELLGAQSPTVPWPCLVLVKPIGRPGDDLLAGQPFEPPATW